MQFTSVLINIAQLLLAVTTGTAGRNVDLSGSMSNAVSQVFCPEYYYFRCEVKESILLLWKINGVETSRLGPHSPSNHYYKKDDYDFYTESVTVGESDSPSDTSYVSHLFIKSSIVDGSVNVACESADGNTSISVEKDLECQEPTVTASGNAYVSSSPPSSQAQPAFCISPDHYYSFRCEVRESLFLVWKVSGVLMLRVEQDSENPFVHKDAINILALDEIRGETASDTTYVSYLWFYSSSDVTATNVTCESNTHASTIKLIHDDNGCQNPGTTTAVFVEEDGPNVNDYAAAGGLAVAGDPGCLVAVSLLFGLIVSHKV